MHNSEKSPSMEMERLVRLAKEEQNHAERERLELLRRELEQELAEAIRQVDAITARINSAEESSWQQTIARWLERIPKPRHGEALALREEMIKRLQEIKAWPDLSENWDMRNCAYERCRLAYYRTLPEAGIEAQREAIDREIAEIDAALATHFANVCAHESAVERIKQEYRARVDMMRSVDRRSDF